MENKKMIKILNEISDLIEKEHYEQALEYIKNKIIELRLEDDPASKYMDNLIKKLK